MAKKINTKRLAARRVSKAEGIVYEVIEDLTKAQTELGPISSGLGQEWWKVSVVKETLKGIMYSLRRARLSGLCDLDEVVAAKLIAGPAIGGSLKGKVAAR